MDVPVVTSKVQVPAQWIDVNGHMNATYYMLVLYDASAAFAEVLGIGDTYVEQTRCGKVVLESHIVYEREVALGDELETRAWLLAVDPKRLHFFYELYNLTRKCRAATGEQVDIHFDLRRRKTVPFPEALYAQLRERVRANLTVPAPVGVGSPIRPPTNPWFD